jgi:hypothetical protein
MQIRSRAGRFAAAALVAITAGCADDAVRPHLPVTFSGTVNIVNGTIIQPNSRVLVLWSVTSGAQAYDYVWGHGSLDVDNGITITFDQEPPDAALNNGQVGVGLVILTSDANLQEGQMVQDFTPGLTGMAAGYSIIFTRNLPESLQSQWPGRFNGYGLGQVEPGQAGNLDTFKSVARDALELIVDDPEKLHAPHWH